MATGRSTFAWETMKPHGGNRLMDTGESQTVAAKIRTGGSSRGHVFLDLYSSDTGWSILVLDERLHPITQAFGQRKRDVWAAIEDDLRGRGLLGP